MLQDLSLKGVPLVSKTLMQRSFPLQGSEVTVVTERFPEAEKVDGQIEMSKEDHHVLHHENDVRVS